MRRGEILNLNWEHIDQEQKRALLPITKNGTARWVPLTHKAMQFYRIYQDTSSISDNRYSLPTSMGSIALESRYDLTHDLRHGRISRMFERGMSIPCHGYQRSQNGSLFRYVQFSNWKTVKARAISLFDKYTFHQILTQNIAA